MRARNQRLEALPRNVAVPVDRGRLLHLAQFVGLAQYALEWQTR